MGRNGAGKSTLLRHAAGLLEPDPGEGRSRADGSALLMQNPGDYFLHERVADEAPTAALESAGLAGLAERHPRDLSGGERQRLALAIVLGGAAAGGGAGPGRADTGDGPGGQEPTVRLAGGTRRQPGWPSCVATHDVEFAAEFATRAVLLADGRVIADGPVGELLSGGWYFATETARILDGAGGALLPEEGAACLRAAGGPAPEAALSVEARR